MVKLVEEKVTGMKMRTIQNLTDLMKKKKSKLTFKMFWPIRLASQNTVWRAEIVLQSATEETFAL